MAFAEHIDELREELERIKNELRERDRERGDREDRPVVGLRTKDLSVANFIKTWRGDPTGPSVGEFLTTFKDFAEAGSWTNEDKIRILRVKLEGTAKRFLNSRTDLKAAGVTFESISDALEERFKDTLPDQHHYSMFQCAVQRKGEDPNEFLDRLRALGELTETKTDDPVKQEVIRSELKRRLLAVFTNGLHGVVGEQVRFRLPKTVEEALQIAVTVHTEERNKHASSQHKGGVFTTLITCYNCNKVGHKARDCRAIRGVGRGQRSLGVPNNTSNRGRGMNFGRRTDQGGASVGQQQSGPGRNSGVECFKCHRMGHFARDCRMQGNQMGLRERAPPSNQRNQ